ncbi:MAG TPA: cation transporter [Planctomycetes bacterium]|nr:cation transporter [Planctomycetota bacterium]
MVGCCGEDGCGLDAHQERQRSTLRIVLAINAIMFAVELGVGLLAGSVSLVADSLDMLGDALVYGFSLYVVARGPGMKARAALLKGWIMALFGLFVLAQAIYKIIVPHVPEAGMIGWMGVLALLTNGACLALLWRHREDDINMTSVWICSRNDIIANVSVLVAAVLVGWTGSGWPDIAVGLGLALVFLRSAFFVLRSAMRSLEESKASVPAPVVDSSPERLP